MQLKIDKRFDKVAKGHSYCGLLSFVLLLLLFCVVVTAVVGVVALVIVGYPLQTASRRVAFYILRQSTLKFGRVLTLNHWPLLLMACCCCLLLLPAAAVGLQQLPRGTAAIDY